MKKILSILMCLCLILSTFTFVGITASAETYSGSCGENLTWSLDTESGELTISGTGDMEDYSIDSVPPWDWYRTYIKLLILENGVTSIGEEAFTYCKSLTDVTFGESVKNIDDYAFYNCNSLTSVTLYNSEIIIEDYALSDCSIIYGYTGSTAEKYANEHNIEFETLTIVENEDDYLYSILDDGTIRITDYLGTASKIKIPSEIDGKKVTEISWHYEDLGDDADFYPGAFQNCESLTSVIIPDSVISIGYSAFRCCSSLKNVVISNSVENIDGFAFYDCDELENIEMGNSVTNINRLAFGSCLSLSKIKIPDSVTSIGDEAFKYCYNLESVTLSNSLKKVGKEAFYYCEALKNITIPASVESVGSNAFKECVSLFSIDVSEESENYSSLDGVLFNKNKTTLICYPQRKTSTSYSIPNSVISIESFAFENNISLISVTIPDSVTSIGSSAFYNCKSLTSITIPDSVTSIGGSAFYNCTSLKSVTIPDSVTSIGSSAFYNTAYYKDDENWKSNILYIDNYLIKANTSVANECEIKSETILIADCAFEYCSSLTSITIPNSVTSIGSDAFRGCRSLTSVIIGDNVTNIGSYAFFGCPSLKNVIISKSVTSIGELAFGCHFSGKNDVSVYEGFTINGYTNSVAQIYANNNGITFIALDAPAHTHAYSSKVTKEPTCSEKGIKTYTCVCGDSYTEIVSTIDHSHKWSTTKSATHFVAGEQVNKCSACGEILSKKAIAKKTYTAPSITGGKKKITVKYKAVSGATGFEVRYKIKGSWKTAKYTTKKAKTIAIKKLKKGKYQVQVRAVKGKVKTNWSKVKKITVK